MAPIYDIPKVQKAIVADKLGSDFKIRVTDDYPVPTPKDDEVLVRLTSTGVCHSDLSFLKNHWNVSMTAKIPGHEGSGYIISHGKDVSQDKFPLGTRVGIPLVSNPCFTCDECAQPDGETFCKNSPFYGCFIDGSWQQYITVNKNYVIKVPDGPDQSLVGPVLCGGVTVYKGLKALQCRAGQWVVLTGAGGGLGSMAIQYAKSMGFKVIAIDSGDEKAQQCKRLGADVFVDFMKEDVVNSVMKTADGKGAHGCVLIAPVKKSIDLAPRFMRIRGAITMIGLPERSVTLDISPAALVFKSLTIRGSLVGSRFDITEALDFVKDGKVQPPVKVYKMEDIHDILTSMDNGTLKGRAVLALE